MLYMANYCGREDVLLGTDLGHAKCLIDFLKNGCNVDSAFDDGAGVLHAATHSNHNSYMHCLIENGANIKKI